ncbi:uncharacterized protein LOC124357549 [Homalodisca vitripennis]|uniref:uncharacterized protein LOC124357549 n=1 Tax=Homalodisca vitripennis TaxID=197043 RepID=UPI001EEC3B2C|nr:uncharacterized protein LOC124357549 [Homalodisca vitripennis]
MKRALVLAFLGVVAVSQCKRPPWYKPCWIYLCGLDLTDPVCAWDPHRGARLFRNDCEMDRHNFCYNRNYAIVEADNNLEEDIKLCAKLKGMVQTADKRPSVVKDGNVMVHFLLEKHNSDKKDKPSWSLSQEHSKQLRYQTQERHRNHHGERIDRINNQFSDTFLNSESSYES